MQKLWFIPLLLLMLLLDGPVRDSLALIEDRDLRWFMGWVSYLGKGWIQAIPCILLMLAGVIIKNRSRMFDAGKTGLFAIAAAGVISQAIKHLIGRPRPRIMDMAGFSLGPSLAADYDSFPSGHAASAFALASSVSFYYPGIKYPLYAYSALVIFSRVYLGAHFLSDIVAGTALGLWTGWMMTHKKREDIMKLVSKYGVVLGITAITFFLFFFRLGEPSLFDIDEAVFSESSREMVETGDWITPQYNYTNRYDKPVLFYWLQASAYKLFGVSEFAARFWSASLGMILVLMVYYLIRKVGNPRWAVISALVMATSFEIIILSHAAITDITLTFFIASSLACFLLGYTGHEDIHKRWYWGMYISMGLAVLTKGPVGVVIPGMIIILFLLLRGEARVVIRDMRPFSGGLLFLAVAMPWYVIEISVNGWEYIDAFFIKHNFTRFTGVVSGHSGPVYYFIPVILLMFFPWSLFIPLGLFSSISIMRRGVTGSRTEASIAFAAIWFLTVFVFFSISRTKLPGYIAPLSPAIAILVGWLWDNYLTSGSRYKRGMKISIALCAATGILIAAGLALLPFIAGKSSAISRHLHEPIDDTAGFYIMGICILSGVIISVIFTLRERRAVSFAVLVGMMVISASVLIGKIVPTADRYLQSPLKEFSRIAGSQLAEGSGGDLIVVGLNKPSILFYAGRSAVFLKSSEMERISETLAEGKSFFIITRDSQIEKLMAMPGIDVIDQRGGYALLSNKRELL